jgi:hypothetical protein
MLVLQAPATFGLLRRNDKVSDAIKRVEITKHRTEYDIDQRKPLAVEIAARSFALIKTVSRPANLSVKSWRFCANAVSSAAE